MRHLTVAAACAAVLCSGAVASAADLSLKDTPVYAPAPVLGWGGFYVGGHLGGLWTGDHDSSASKRTCREENNGGGDEGGDDDDHHSCGDKKPAESFVATAPDPKLICTDWAPTGDVRFQDDNDVKFIGGVHVGYNWQSQSAVLGIEADVDFADEFDYLSTVRARLGYASGDFLIYATAGVAFAKRDDTFNFSTPVASYRFDNGNDTDVGAVVGGGVEYKLNPNLSVGLEGLYYFFGDESHNYSVTEGDTTLNVHDNWDKDIWTLRARISYHFGEDYAEPLK
jgi:outer membrane immunogenic protein